MNKIRVVKISMFGMLILVTITAAFFLGSKFALEHLSIKKVDPYELGLAMKTDHFFRTYRENTLLLTGTVLRMDQKNGLSEIVFAQTNNIDVRCSIKTPSVQPKVGSQVSIATEAARAVRIANGVLLRDCSLL